MNETKNEKKLHNDVMVFAMNWIAWAKNIELTTENRKIPSKLIRTKESPCRSPSLVILFPIRRIAASHSWLD